MAIGWDYRFIIIFKNPSSRQREEFLVFIDIITDLFTNIFYLLAPQSHRTLQALMSGNSNQKLVSYLWPPPSSQFSTSHPSLCPGVSTFSASPESLTSSASPSSLLLSGPSLLLGWISAIAHYVTHCGTVHEKTEAMQESRGGEEEVFLHKRQECYFRSKMEQRYTSLRTMLACLAFGPHLGKWFITRRKGKWRS